MGHCSERLKIKSHQGLVKIGEVWVAREVDHGLVVPKDSSSNPTENLS